MESNANCHQDYGKDNIRQLAEHFGVTLLFNLNTPEASMLTSDTWSAGKITINFPLFWVLGRKSWSFTLNASL